MNSNEPSTGIVIESYTHDINQVVIAREPDIKMLHFLYLPRHPDINFGDTIIINFHTSQYWVHHGNPHLTYRIFPITFPGTLLLELISDQMNKDSK